MLKRKFLSLVLALVMAWSLLLPASAAGRTYTISSLEELEAFASQVNAGNTYQGDTVLLAADITLNDGLVGRDGSLNSGSFDTWTPIGTEKAPFQGTFDGQGHTVTGLYVNNSEAQYQGLFGVVDKAAISNVTVKDSYFHLKIYGGAVVGKAGNGSVVASCHNDNSSITTENDSGGIVGWTDSSHVYNCSVDGYCYSGRCSGGIVGDVYTNSKIYNCYFAGEVDGQNLVGGISGGSTSANIQNCLVAGTVSGGCLIAGGAGSRTLTNCYALQSDSVNSGLSMGTSANTLRTFDSAQAVFGEAVAVSGAGAYTKAVDALNAWVSQQDRDQDYSPWVQTSLYPYLRDGVTSAIKTSYDSQVSAWSSQDMEDVYKEGLIPDSLIGEDLTKDINRQEFAAVCVKVYENLAATQALPATINPFSDCKDIEVLKAYNVGITEGTGAATFSPYALLSREQAATMLTRTFKRVTMPGWTLDTDSRYPLSYTKPAAFADDASISSWARDSVYFMAANGIINGVGSNLFAPRNVTDRQTAEGYANATREQALTIALRTVRNLG